MAKRFVLSKLNADDVEDLCVLLRGRRDELAKAYAQIERLEPAPRIVAWSSGSVNGLQIRSRRPGL